MKPLSAPASSLPQRAVVMDVLNAALRAADPYLAVRYTLEQAPLSTEGRVYVIGAGKAAAAMARAAEETLGSRIAGGLVVDKDIPPAHGLERVEIVEAGHPVPDERGVAASLRLLEIARSATADDLVLCLISGGGSALLTAPAEGITLGDVRAVTALLLRSGATINELNAVRKHLSRISGGQLARAIYPASTLSLILSDVTGSPLDVIASGPTVPDPTTFGDALEVLSCYALLGQAPAAVVHRLQLGASGAIDETPKPADPAFDLVTNRLVANNVLAVEAAARRAIELGFTTQIVSTYLEGEAREVGRVLGGIAREVVAYARPVARPACLLFGGETTVSLGPGSAGVGGRNSELALSAAFTLRGLGPHALVASLATDGGDGASPGAGAIVDGTTIDKGTGAGLDAAHYLAAHDSYTFLNRTGDAIVSGPTGTNVNDIMVVFVFDGE